MFQEDIINIYGLVMVFHNPEKEWKIRKCSWPSTIIKDLFLLVKRYKKDEPAKEGRGRMLPINSMSSPAIRVAQLHIYPDFFTQIPFWCKVRYKFHVPQQLIQPFLTAVLSLINTIILFGPWGFPDPIGSSSGHAVLASLVFVNCLLQIHNSKTVSSP